MTVTITPDSAAVSANAAAMDPRASGRVMKSKASRPHPAAPAQNAGLCSRGMERYHRGKAGSGDAVVVGTDEGGASGIEFS